MGALVRVLAKWGHAGRVLVVAVLAVVGIVAATTVIAEGVARVLRQASSASGPPAAQASSESQSAKQARQATEAGALRFETASIEPNLSGSPELGGIRLESGGRFIATNQTLLDLVAFAYQRHGFDRREVWGGPPGSSAVRFDVVAKAPGDHVFDRDGTPQSTLAMLRTLLAERFKLKLRFASKEGPVYALLMATSDGKPGPQLRLSDRDCGSLMDATINKGQQPSGPACGMARYPRRLVGSGLTMASLGTILAPLVKRRVVDRTGLTGSFDLEVEGVEVVPTPVQGPSSRPSTTELSLFKTLPEQLGLKLGATMAPIEIVVVEYAEPPYESGPSR